MASRKVYIDVIVDDKGTTKRLAVDSAKLDTLLGKQEKSTNRATKAQRGLAQTAASGSKNFANLSSGITGGLVPAYATLAAQIFAVTAAFNFLKDAGSLRQLQQGQLAYAAATGTSLKALTKDLQRATNAQLGFRDAAQSAAIGTAAGLDPEQITKIGKAAADASQVLGRDLTDSFNRLTRGITKAEPELLDELGIILRLDTATRNYKEALGITGELTAFQRSQAVSNEVLAQAEEKYGRVLDATGRTTNSFAQLATAFEEITNSIRNFAVDFLNPIAATLKEMPGLIALAFAPFTAQVVGAALPGLGRVQVALAGLADKAKASAKASTKATKKLMKDQEAVAKNPAVRKAYADNIKKEAQANLKGVKVHKRSLLQRIKNGEQLSKKEIATVRANLKKQARGYVIKDKQIKGSLHRTLNQMEILNNTASSKIEGRMKLMAAQTKIALQSIVPTAQVVFAKVAGAAVVAGNLISGALSLISWVSLIVTLGALVYAFFRSKDAAEKTAPAYDYLGEKLQILRDESEKFIAIQNIMFGNFEDGNKVLENFGRRLGNVGNTMLSDEFKKTGDLFKSYDESVASATASLGGLADKQQTAQRVLDGLVELNQQGQASTTELSAARSSLASATEAYTKAQEASTRSFTDFINLEENKNAEGVKGLQILLDERKEIESITNERFRGNAAVSEYLSLLDKLNRGETVDIQNLLKKRVAVQDIGAAVSELTRLETENSRAITAIEQETLPLNKYDQRIEAIGTELNLIERLRVANGQLTKEEEERIAFLEERLNLMRSLAQLEFTINSANLAIQKTEIQLSMGRTKLLRDDVRLVGKIAQNQVKIFETEQKIAQAQYLLTRDRQENNKLLNSQNKAIREQAQTESASLDAREREIGIQQHNLDILKLQGDELERQKNELYQITDAAGQAFESSLQKNLADIIKGKESSLSDAVAKIAQATLNSVADSLSTIFTRKIMKAITGQKDPDEKMAEAIANSTNQGATVMKQKIVGGAAEGGAIIAERIKAALASQPMVTPSGSVTSPTGTGFNQVLQDQGFSQSQIDKAKGAKTSKFFFEEEDFDAIDKEKKPLSYLERIFGAKEMKGQDEVTMGSEGGMESLNLNKTGGSFGNFLGSLGDIFNKNAEGGLAEKLGNVFDAGGNLFGDIFGGLPDLFGNLFGDLFGSLGSLFGKGGAGGGGLLSGLASMIPGIGPVLGGALGIFGLKNGGIMNNGSKVSGYATGGIANGSEQGHLAMLHGREAVVPLPNGNKIPVDMKGAGPGMQNNNVTVNVSTDGQTQSSANGAMGENLGQVIAAAVQKELHNQKRAGGILNKHGAA